MIQIETISWEWHSNHNNKILDIIWGTLLVVIDRLFYIYPTIVPRAQSIELDISMTFYEFSKIAPF